MHQRLEKSKIVDWWVAPEKSVMRFANILSGENPLNGNFLVVGYYNDGENELATSTNRVVKITDEGVITAQGTFYTFEEAHELYLQFLIKANQENTVIAFNWDYTSKFSKRKLIADIAEKENVKEGVVFDFIRDKGTPEMFFGYSKTLSANVVLSTFNKRNICIKLGIPKSVKSDICTSSFAFYDETMKRLEEVKRIFREKVKDSCISVVVQNNKKRKK